MAYRLDPRIATPVELRRVLNEQLGRAAARLRSADPPSVDDVHDVRTHLKKARSALRLARGDLGRAVQRHANGELRDAARALAAARETGAMGETLDRLAATDPDRATQDAVAEVRRGLVDHADEAPPLGRAGVRATAISIERTNAWLQQVPARAEGWSALAVGFDREYRRGRARYRNLAVEPAAVELHEWRKRAKDLWYHQRLLRDGWPAGQRPVRRAAARLADLLGEDHDLADLLDRLAAFDDRPDRSSDRRDRRPDPVAVDLVASVAEAERVARRIEARELGGYLYADRPDAWTARHGAWWGHGLTCNGGPRPA